VSHLVSGKRKGGATGMADIRRVMQIGNGSRAAIVRRCTVLGRPASVRPPPQAPK